MDAISNITYKRMEAKVNEILYKTGLIKTSEQVEMLMKEVVKPLVEANESLRKDNHMAQEELRAMVGARTF